MLDSVNKAMSETLLAEESSNFNLVPRVFRIATGLKDENNHHKSLVCLIDLLIHESGYCLCNNVQDPTPITAIWQCDTKNVPKNYESLEDGTYQLTFRITSLPGAGCKLVAVPIGDMLLVNLIPMLTDIESRVICLHTLKYVNCGSKETDGHFINIKELSHRIKNELSIPILCEYLSRENMINPSLGGLPEEIVILIMKKYLDKRSRQKLSQCSRYYYELYKSNFR